MREHLRALIAISIHALLTESDRFPVIGTDPSAIFQSTLSSRRATPDTLSSSRVEKKFQSTLSSRRATAEFMMALDAAQISIHALLTESDMIWTGALTPDVEFQSTLSSRRATPPGRGGFGHGNDFNPRSPHGERLQFQFCPVARINFNPRSPHGERRSPVIGTDPSAIISIHALLTESD